jgi:hypothetical protein
MIGSSGLSGMRSAKTLVDTTLEELDLESLFEDLY